MADNNIPRCQKPVAEPGMLESLCVELQLSILEAFESPSALFKYLAASPVALAVYLRNKRSVLVNCLENTLTADGMLAARKNRMLDLDPTTTRAQLQAIDGSVGVKALDSVTQDYIIRLCMRQETLVDHALAQLWLHEHSHQCHNLWKIPKWWFNSPSATGSLGWGRVRSQLRSRLQSGFTHMELYFRLGMWDRLTFSSHPEYYNWATMSGVIADDPPVAGQWKDEGAGIDMLLVASVLDYDRLQAKLALRKMYRGVGGTSTNRLLPQHSGVFYDIGKMLKDTGTWGRNVPQPSSEPDQVKAFDYVYITWRDAVKALLENRMKDPPIFLPMARRVKLDLCRDYLRALKRRANN